MTDSMRIVLADDDADLLELLRINLEAEGHTVKVATDGLEALDLVVASHPDVVVLDVMMPGIDGLEVTRRLRALPETASLPIVLLTARGTNPQILEGWQSGANYYITKPFELEHLLYFIELMQERPLVRDEQEQSAAAAG
jgi:two-component system, OmpR family, phosphate regulon response regulator PhoB